MTAFDAPDTVRDEMEAERWTEDGLAPGTCPECDGNEYVHRGYGRTQRREPCPGCVIGVLS